MQLTDRRAGLPTRSSSTRSAPADTITRNRARTHAHTHKHAHTPIHTLHLHTHWSLRRCCLYLLFSACAARTRASCTPRLAAAAVLFACLPNQLLLSLVVGAILWLLLVRLQAAAYRSCFCCSARMLGSSQGRHRERVRVCVWTLCPCRVFAPAAPRDRNKSAALRRDPNNSAALRPCRVFQRDASGPGWGGTGGRLWLGPAPATACGRLVPLTVIGDRWVEY